MLSNNTPPLKKLTPVGCLSGMAGKVVQTSSAYDGELSPILFLAITLQRTNKVIKSKISRFLGNQETRNFRRVRYYR